MPIPSNQITVAEIQMFGQINAGGSNTHNTVTTFHYRRTAVSPPLSKAALEAAWQAAVGIKIVDALNVKWTQLRNHVRWINDATDPPFEVSEPNIGVVAGDAMTQHCALFILFRTALRGKSYRGGIHLGALSEADTTAPAEDVLNAAALARFGAVVTALKTPIIDTGPNTWNLCILSRKGSLLQTNPTTVVTNDVTDVKPNKRIGRMRHREVASQY